MPAAYDDWMNKPHLESCLSGIDSPPNSDVLNQHAPKHVTGKRMRPAERVLIYVGIFFLFALAAASQTPGTLSASGSPANPGNSKYHQLTGEGRLNWFAQSTVGPPSLIGGTISAGWGTLFNSPKEYGPHWAGFGKRYGMRFTGVSVSNAMEGGLGALWGEDPRYIRAKGQPFKSRVGRVIKMTFLAYDKNGETMPAYARYIAIPGNNFLSNTWRADSEADASDAVQRTLTGFLGRMAGNAFQEFWPDVSKHLFKRDHEDDAPIALTSTAELLDGTSAQNQAE